jgi:hypothetical protein
MAVNIGKTHNTNVEWITQLTDQKEPFEEFKAKLKI